MDSDGWNAGDEIVARFMLALDGLTALDHLARHPPAHLDEADLRARIAMIRGLRPLDWDRQRRDQEEHEERAAVMQLYTAFEGLLRRDALWRGFEPAARFHHAFSANAIKARDGAFVRFPEWLVCWRTALKAVQAPQPQFARTLSQLKTIFVHERNSLMHTDRTPCPPLMRVRQQLGTAYCTLRRFADDFGVCDE